MKFNLFCKYSFVTLYWVFMTYVAILVLKEPWKTVIVYKKVMKDPNQTAQNSTVSEEDYNS